MATGTIKREIPWRDSAGRSAGKLYAGDVVYGSVTTVFNFYKIVRKSNGNVLTISGTCSSAGTDISIVDDAPPPPPPPPPSGKVPFRLVVEGFEVYQGELTRK